MLSGKPASVCATKYNRHHYYDRGVLPTERGGRLAYKGVQVFAALRF